MIEAEDYITPIAFEFHGILSSELMGIEPKEPGSIHMRMSSVTTFYNNLSPDYHLIFQDWYQSISLQAEILDTLIKKHLISQYAPSLLDCSCGIGTQAIGLALRGYNVHATDISSKEIDRAEKEAKSLNATVTFGVADFRYLDKQVKGTFNVVISCDNSIPHMLTDEDLLLAAKSMKAKVNQNGLLLMSIRDYDTILEEKPRVDPPRILDTPDGRRITFQVWDWETSRNIYTMTHFIIKQADNGWKTISNQTQYRALRRTELTHILKQAGFTTVSWHMPEKSGYYQPIVIANP